MTERRATRSSVPTAEHLAFRADMLALLRKHGDEMPAEHMLAIAAHMVGQLVAMQDQRRFTSEIVMAVVSENIEQGNREAIEALIDNTEGTA